MINKTHLREAMLTLTGAKLAQAHKTYDSFLMSAILGRSETIESDEQAQAESAADLAEAFGDREHAAEATIAALQTVDFGPKRAVSPGAVVRFGERLLVVAVSTAEFECQGKKFIGISTAVPIYQALKGKVRGEDREFNGRKLHLHEIY